MHKTILHIDINSYFATLVQQENPKLRGKPVGIIKDVGRTCIIAASKEAKQQGVGTGDRFSDVRHLCPDLILVPASFERYLDATHKLKDIFENISPNVYIYSLDEAFVDISDCKQHLYSDVEHLATHIQESIKKNLGEWVTCNIGISHNRLLAKMASEITPKGTYLIIDQDNLDSVLASVSFKDVCGIGYRLTKKLNKIGITNPFQLRFFSQEDLEPLFGPFWSVELLKIAWGEESHGLSLIDRPSGHMKSVGRSITGYKLCDNEEEIRAILYNLVEEATHKLRRMNLAGRHISIFLSGQNQHYYNHQTLKNPVNTSQQVFEVIYYNLYQQWQRSFRVIKFGVRIGLLQSIKSQQLTLFDDNHYFMKLTQAVDSINHKFGLFTIRSATMINQPIIKPEVTGFLGDGKYLGLRN